MRRHGPLVLISVLAATGLVLAVPVLHAGAEPVAGPRLSLLVLAALWAVFELAVLSYQLGSEKDAPDEVILTEIPLALGLLFAAPVDVLLAGVGVPILIDVVRRHRSAVKQLFNGANRVVEVALAVLIYRALDPGDPFSLQGWLDLSLAVTASGLASALALASVISLAVGRPLGRDLGVRMGLAVPVCLISAAAAFVAGSALHSTIATIGPLVVLLSAVLVLMLFTSLLTERHTNLIRLHGLGVRLADQREPDSILEAALGASAEIMVAPRVSFYLPTSPQQGGVWLEVRKDGDGTVHRTHVSGATVPSARGLGPDRRTIVTSAPLASGSELVLSVARGEGPSRPFRNGDSRLLDMIARQTGGDLGTAQLIARLSHDALHDSLTELANRRLLLEALDERLAANDHVQIIWLGIHDLQAVNGALGYERGDELLTQIGSRLRASTRSDSVVARVGGDEFALLLPASSDRSFDSRAVSVLLDALAQPFALTGLEIVARASAGVATGDGGSEATSQDLLRRADLAMRFARRSGRPFEYYAPRLETATSERLRLAAELRAGIPRGELTVYGQPQVRLGDGEVVGVEALVRWSHPRLGLLSPNAFVSLAEQTGLGAPMTAWVLDAALDALASWRKSGLDLNISVNVSPDSFGDHKLLELVERQLALRALSGERLTLEITEGDLFSHTEATGHIFRDLSALGVKVSIDDFGTGFSSLSRLRRLPVDEIKIDRSFVSSMLRNDDDAAIVRSVVELGRALGLACVAEGVEDARTYAALQRLGCDAAQGYHIAAPLPLAQLAGWVTRTRDRSGENRASRSVNGR